MSTIKGIFEPFYSYVSSQLNARKILLSNPQYIDETKGNIDTNGEFDESFYQLNMKDFYLGDKGFRNQRAFHSYTTEKQCIIRMASGVDIREENNLLDAYETHLTGPQLARNWVLESGIRGRFGNQRSGFSEGNFSTMEGEAYGDASTRSDSADGFGIVPMPGIIDATIDTKTEDGSLREATINFVCHNRRQLEILEALYMRPGYPILLEWGWDPYISFSEGKLGNQLESIKTNKNEFSVLDEFFQSQSSINSLNNTISLYKENSEGNYDGFIGYVKNFSFKVREDGGYDCVTSIIAHGEILESLKSTVKVTSKLYGVGDKEIYNLQEPLDEKEITDEFSFYLKSIKANLDKAGNKAIIEYTGTDREEDSTTLMDKIEISALLAAVQNPLAKASVLLFQKLGFTPTLADVLAREARQKASSISGIRENNIFYKNEDDEVIPIHKLNKVSPDYSKGLEEIKNLIKEVAKIGDPELILSKEDWEDYPLDINRTEKEDNWLEGTWGTFEDWMNGEKTRTGERYLSSGFDPLFEGTILKEISISDRSEDSSGVKKKIFVRWDLICQILNRKITPQYKKDHALVELTYLNPNEETYTIAEHPSKRGDDSKKVDSPTDKYYLQYALPDNKAIFTTDTDQLKPGPSNFENSDLGSVSTPKGTPIVDTTPQPPLLGRSFDTDVCLMPHQLPPEQWNKGRNSGLIGKTLKRGIHQLTSFYNVGSSLNDIGMVYFNLDHLISTYENLTLEEYTTTDSLGEERTKRRLKKEFSFHDWITTIWNDVNDACGGFYDFGLHVEHSRPNVVRIIDFTFKGKPSDVSMNRPIFQFNPQGLASITRESEFSSKIDNDFASVISIAAQSPNDIHSLEAMSFKAFHKNIKNRFTSPENDEEGRIAKLKQQYETYSQEIQNYNNAINSLKYLITKMNRSNYETELINPLDNEADWEKRKPISPDVAKSFASKLEEMRNKIEARHGTINEDGYPNNMPEESAQFNQTTNENPVTGEPSIKVDIGGTNTNLRPYIGSFREGTTYSRNAIIPITVSMTLDGIAGIHPLQIFQIHPEKLPKGYQNENIVFVIKKETNKITSGQDWTTEITGYLTLLDGNPNMGANPETLKKDNSPNILDDVDNLKTFYPNADKLRNDIEQLIELGFLYFIIEEKIGASTITDPDPQLSSGGDITPLLVEKTMSIFSSIKKKLKNHLSVKIRITAGNDLFHQQERPNSKHTVGKALDFTIDPYNPQTKAAVEETLTEHNLYFDNDYENTDVDDHFHFQV